jgi:hypothetical protein
MNRHAVKLVVAADPNAASDIDPVLGGVMEEAHTCPGCGRTETRRSS